MALEKRWTKFAGQSHRSSDSFLREGILDQVLFFTATFIFSKPVRATCNGS
jgi:hypothetical protein